MQEPKGQPRRQQPEPRPLGPLGLRRQQTLPKSRSFSAHFRPFLTAPFSKQAPLVGVHMGLWPVITGGKSAAFMEGGQVQVLGSFGDTASHLPDCCSLHALVSDAEGPYLNRPFSAEAPSRSRQFAQPNLIKTSHLATCDPERELTPCTARSK